jgi:hypothetical protein
MSRSLRTIAPGLLLLCFAASLHGEVLVRWDLDEMPARESLGISQMLVPADNGAAVQNAIALGYRVYVEVGASNLASFSLPAGGLAGVVVKGEASPESLLALRNRLASSSARVLLLDERGKWPHIRQHQVTRRNDVLQVAGRTAQPWIESNGALLRIAQATQRGTPLLLTYGWEPLTLAEADEGPGLEHYLVAIAEAGSFGADLVLPLHGRFQRSLLLGRPPARAWWDEIRRYIEFYSWDLPGRYRPIANIGVVTAEPMRWYEVMNLLVRHNLPFELIAPERLSDGALSSFDLLIVLDQPAAARIEILTEFARRGGAVVVAGFEGRFPWQSVTPVRQTEGRVSYAFGKGRVVEMVDGVVDPNTFALEVRQILGREKRVIDIWNGITVLTAPYRDPGDTTVLVTALNYAHQPLPVQLRIPGIFSVVHYETPEDGMALLPHRHRDGQTEFVLPALRIGARVFLSEGGL